ncbi:DEAD/DEAH box helicase [Candidatus Foliamicus sp.]
MSEDSIHFDSLDLPPPIKAGIRRAGFETLTPIQAKALPLAMSGRDVAGQAQTGTGKTAAFLLAIFNRLLRNPTPKRSPESSPRAVVLAPTRELAQQIERDAQLLGAATGLSMMVVYGGAAYKSQRERLSRGTDLLIGTPGRLLDYYRQGVFSLSRVEVIVIDEADRMYDLGFIRDIRYVMRRLPPRDKRLSMLFSATLGYLVLELATTHLNNPEIVRIEPDKKVVDEVAQRLYYPASEEKAPLLAALLSEQGVERSMVFVNTRREADRLARWLDGQAVKAQAISGDVPQSKRMQMLKLFHDGELPVLVATDVASRGLHVPDVTHVFNFDLPQNPEDYVHRIGRTARAGEMGHAVSFACEHYAYSLPEIEAFIGHAIQRESIDPDMLAPYAEAPAPRAQPAKDYSARSRRPARRRAGRR